MIENRPLVFPSYGKEECFSAYSRYKILEAFMTQERGSTNPAEYDYSHQGSVDAQLVRHPTIDRQALRQYPHGQYIVQGETCLRH